MASVVVIGAGIIGAAIADTLSSSGHRVTIFDMRAPGAGASQASAGVLAPWIEATPGSPLLALGVEGLARWDGFVRRLRERVPGSRFAYARTGTLEVALTDADVDRLRRAAAWLASEGVEHTWFDGSALRAHAPVLTPTALAGLHIARHGFVDVSGLVRTLLHAARLQGATLVTPVDVLHVDADAASAAVTHGSRDGHVKIACDVVVLAAGSWSSRVRVADLPPMDVRPIRGQLLQLRWRGDTPPAQSIWSADCYTVPWDDGTLLVGATVEDVGFDERSTADGVRGLLDAVATLLPEAAQASLDAVRVGLRPVTSDRLPIIGPLPGQPRVLAATGHYRNGILLAPLTAHRVEAMIDDLVGARQG